MSALALLWASACSSDEGGEHSPASAGGSTSSTPAAHGGQSSPNSAGGTSANGGAIANGGTSASGGTSANSASECNVCQHAQACCLALAKVQYADPDPCLTFTTNCGQFSGKAEETIVASCQTYLTRQKSNGLPDCQ